MNILYVDCKDTFTVDEVRALHDYVASKVGEDNLITLPMQTNLLYDVDLEGLCRVRNMLNEAIESKMKSLDKSEE